MSQPEEVGIPLVWIGLEELSVQLANQAICQYTPDGQFIVSIGQMAPPVLLGSPEEIRQEVKRLSHIAVKPLLRVNFSESSLRDLLRIIQTNLEQFEAQKKAEAQ